VSDDYRPREHDALVEPVFGGLGVGEARPEPVGWWRRLWRALFRLVRPSKPGGGP
jgi:hypothetical protein